MNSFRLILVFLLSHSLSACALSGGPVSGKVLEEGTNKPIPGAIVVVRWQGSVSSLADSQGVCVHVDSMATDEQGRYQFAPWSKPSKVGLVSDLAPSISAYRIGFGDPQTPKWQDKGVYLAPFKGASGARLEYLLQSGGKECGPREDYAAKLIPLYRALYDEAKLVAVTKEDRKIVKSLHFSLDTLELGEKEATRRLTEGVYEK